jgi:hypothetical protein
LVLPQLWQGIAMILPHWLQKRLPDSFSAPQRPHLSIKGVLSTLCWCLPNLPIPVRAAQLGQNLESGGTSAPQLLQGELNLLPQYIQKLRPISLSALHLVHFTCRI